MRNALAVCALLLLISGCAAQAPADQVTLKGTVRVCQGQQCVDQDSRTVTFQGPAIDAEAERRLAALEQLAHNNPKAAYDLGLRLMRGDGVTRDSYQGIEWLRQAGDGGLVDAQLALGRLYLTGYEEMGADPAEAAAWLSRAAAKGSKEAQQLIPQAQAAQQDEQTRYQIREAYRTSWSRWYASTPYYWVWGNAGWHLR